MEKQSGLVSVVFNGRAYKMTAEQVRVVQARLARLEQFSRELRTEKVLQPNHKNQFAGWLGTKHNEEAHCIVQYQLWSNGCSGGSHGHDSAWMDKPQKPESSGHAYTTT